MNLVTVNATENAFLMAFSVPLCEIPLQFLFSETQQVVREISDDISYLGGLSLEQAFPLDDIPSTPITALQE